MRAACIGEPVLGNSCALAHATHSATRSARVLAQSDGPSIVGYGMHGLWTGAELGLAGGFLATGSRYTSGEWRKLAIGAGLGAIAGVGAGLSLGIVDGGADSSTGWFVLRDMGYGTTLGALTGTAVGALFLLDGGRPKDLLTGASFGALIGAGAGLAIGLLEGSDDGEREPRRATHAGVRFALLADEHSLLPVPGVDARF